MFAPILWAMISINQTMNVKFVRLWCTILQILHTRFHLKCLIVPHSAYHKSASTKIFCTIIIAETRSHSSILLRLSSFCALYSVAPSWIDHIMQILHCAVCYLLRGHIACANNAKIIKILHLINPLIVHEMNWFDLVVKHLYFCTNAENGFVSELI